MKGIKIVCYLRRGKYESWCTKNGDLRNHSKAEFIEMNKVIMIMIIISSGVNTGIGAWETEN